MKILEKWWFWLGLSFLVYANTLNHEYTIDDMIVVSSNDLTKKGISGIPEIFSHSYLFGYDGREDESYRPLTLTTFAIERSLFDADPTASHFIQVLLYGLCMLVVYRFLINLYGERKKQMVAVLTLLFLLHPLHTEVVANVKSRDELLAGLFLIGALWAFSSWAKEQKSWKLILSLLLFFAGCLSKETAVLGVVLFPAILYFQERKNVKEVIKHSIIFSIPFGLYFLIRFMVLSDVLIEDPIDPVANTLALAESSSERIGTNFVLFGKYILLVFFPLKLSWDYSVGTFHLVPFLSTWSLVGAFIAAGIIALLMYGIIKRKKIGFGALLFVSTFALTSNFFFLINCTLGERFMFIPLLGILMISIPLISEVIEEQGIRFKYTLVIIFASLFLVRTVSRNLDWKNNLSIYEAGIKASPRSVKTHFNLATEYLEQGNRATSKLEKIDWYERSIDQFMRAKELYPKYANIYENSGFVFAELGKLGRSQEETISWYTKGLKEIDYGLKSLKLRKPGMFQNKFFLLEQLISLTQDSSKKEQYMIEMVNTVAMIEDKSPEDYQRAIYYFREMKDDAQVIQLTQELVSKYPEKKNDLLVLSEEFFKKGNFETSLKLMTFYTERFPDDLSSRSNRGMLLEILGKKEEAMKVYEEILKIDPNQQHTRQLHDKLKLTL